MKLIFTPASWEFYEPSVNEHIQSLQNALHMQSTKWFAVGIMLGGHQRARGTVASSLGWKECGKLQNSSAKQERGKEVNETNKKILLPASIKNLLKVWLIHHPSLQFHSSKELVHVQPHWNPGPWFLPLPAGSVLLPRCLLISNFNWLENHITPPTGLCLWERRARAENPTWEAHTWSKVLCLENEEVGLTQWSPKPALTLYGSVIQRHPRITRAEPVAFLMHNRLEGSNWWELKSQVPSIAVCPWRLLGTWRSYFARVLNISLIRKPLSGCLESQRLLFQKRARWGNNRGQWNILILASSF